MANESAQKTYVNLIVRSKAISGLKTTRKLISEIKIQLLDQFRVFLLDETVPFCTNTPAGPDGPEPKLPWQDFHALRRLIRAHDPEAWGHEWKLEPHMIGEWQKTRQISETQAQWLTQRSSRQLAYALTQAQKQERTLRQDLRRVPVWRIGASKPVRQALGAVQHQIAELTQRQQALQTLQARYVTPAQERQRQQRYQRQLRQPGPRLPPTHRPGGPGWHWDMTQEQTQRQRQHQGHS